METLAELAQRCEGAHHDKGGWRAKCPVHQGSSDTSLHLWEEHGEIRVHCFAGCLGTTVMEHLGLARAPRRARYDALYTYHDLQGYPRFQVVRVQHPTRGKTFFQRRPHPTEPGQWLNDLKGVSLVLYRLPELAPAIAGGLPIYLVEGEKDVETLRAAGLVATCNPMGAEKWQDSYSETLRGASIILLPDNDAPGRKHADLVTRRLSGYVRSLVRVDLPDLPAHGDVSDWLPTHSLEALQALIQAARPAVVAPHLVLTKLASVEPEAVTYLWEPYVPRGKLTLLEGDPGLGKTFLMFALATAVTQGYSLPSQDGRVSPARYPPGTVIYLSAEDGIADTLRPRAGILGADLERLYVLEGWTTTGELLPWTFAQLTLLREAIHDLQASLVVIDPLQAYLGADVDMHRANEVRPLLMQLGQVAAQTRCAIVPLRHWNKQVGGKLLYRGMGSIDFSAAARSVLVIGEAPDDERLRIVAQIKHSFGPTGRSMVFSLAADGFHWHGASELDGDSLTRMQPRKREHQLSNAAKWLKQALQDGPQPQTLIQTAAEAVGIAERTLNRAKAMLGILSSKSHGDGRWYWRLPDFQPWDREPGDEDPD